MCLCFVHVPCPKKHRFFRKNLFRCRLPMRQKCQKRQLAPTGKSLSLLRDSLCEFPPFFRSFLTRIVGSAFANRNDFRFGHCSRGVKRGRFGERFGANFHGAHKDKMSTNTDEGACREILPVMLQIQTNLLQAVIRNRERICTLRKGLQILAEQQQDPMAKSKLSELIANMPACADPPSRPLIL